jgi:hypothetical protein
VSGFGLTDLPSKAPVVNPTIRSGGTTIAGPLGHEHSETTDIPEVFSPMAHPIARTGTGTPFAELQVPPAEKQVLLAGIRTVVA